MDDNRDIGSRDQALFDSIWKEYVIKDVVASSKIARRHRLRQTLKKVVLQRDTHLLEVGCAGGFSVDYLEGLYRSYTGVDYSTALIGHAIQRFVRPNTRFHAVNIKEYQPDAQFDVILMIGVLHHIDDLDYVLGRLKDMLKPGGCLIANEPHPANPLISLARAIRKRIDPRYSEDQKELEIEELERLFVGRNVGREPAFVTDAHAVARFHQHGSQGLVDFTAPAHGFAEARRPVGGDHILLKIRSLPASVCASVHDVQHRHG